MLSSVLQHKVTTMLPEAHLALFSLPETAIQLYLINKNYPRQPLPYEQMMRLMDEPFYWAFCWASGAVLARYILENSDAIRGKRVVDFGCGSGVVAIAAAKAGANEVIACDCDPMAIEATKANAALNRVALTVSDDFHAIDGEIDLIVAADVLYDRDNLFWLKDFRDKSRDVLVADSRIKNFDEPGYKYLDTFQSCTLPDLDESAEFRSVNLYSSVGIKT